MSIKNIFSSKVLGVDLGNNSLKIVLAGWKGRELKIYRYLEIDRTYLNNENYLLNEVFSNESRYRKLSLSLNLEDYEYDFFRFPHITSKDLGRALKNKYHQDKYENFLIQYIEGENFDIREVLTLLIEKEKVARHRERLRKLFLWPKALNLNNMNIVKLLSFSGLVNNNYKLENKNIMSLDLGYKNVDFTIFKNENIRYLKSFNRGAINFYSKLTKEESEIKLFQSYLEDIDNIFKLTSNNVVDASILEYLNDLLDLIRININYFMEEYNEDIDLIILTGGLSNICGIDNLITTRLDKQTIVLNKLDSIGGEDLPLNIYGNAVGSVIKAKEIAYV